MHPNGSIRILMYSHDTFGLGHLTRTVRIARALRARYGTASILILTGSPVATYMPLPEGADLVKLPTVVKAGAERYRARDLEVTFGQVKRLRRDLIRRAAESFRPHLFLVDNVPLGMKGEILPTLRWFRASSPGTKIALDLRDILDDPSVIREAWRRDGVPEALDSLYDRIFVLGDSVFFDSAAAYDLPSSKTVHLGYGTPEVRASKRPGTKRTRAPRILLTVGGGGDGAGFLERALLGLSDGAIDEVSGRRPRASARIEVVTGPLMDPEGKRRIAARAMQIGALVHEFVPDLPARMSRADLVVAMAGYNTCCEILSHARAALVVPRRTPRIEQLLRAEAFERRGLVRVLPSIESEPGEIAAAIRRALEQGPWIDQGQMPVVGGFARLAEEAGSLCPELERPPAVVVSQPAQRARAAPAPSPRGGGASAPSTGGHDVWLRPGTSARIPAGSRQSES